MTHPDDDYRDLLGDHPDGDLMNLIADLERVHSVRHPGEPRVAAAHAWDRWRQQLNRSAGSGDLLGRGGLRRIPGSVRPRPWIPAGRVRMHAISMVVATLVIVTSALGYLRLTQPSPVSAQGILRHVASSLSSPRPNTVLHQVRVVTLTSYHSTQSQVVDEWTQWDAKGQINRQVTSIKRPSGALLSRTLISGATVQTYTPADKTIRPTSVPPLFAVAPVPPAIVSVGPAQLVYAAQSRPKGDVQLMAPRVIGKHTAEVVAVGGLGVPGAPPPVPGNGPTPHTVLLVDPQSYALLGAETYVDGAEIRLRITLNQTLAPSDVPRGTFALRAPPGARVVVLQQLPGPPVSAPGSSQATPEPAVTPPESGADA